MSTLALTALVTLIVLSMQSEVNLMLQSRTLKLYLLFQRYLASLQRPEDTELAMLTRTVSTIPGASPEEYLMFLLRAHNNEHKDSLPVVDMLW